MIPEAPRIARGDSGVWGGKGTLRPMPAARDREPVVGAVGPSCPSRSLWFNAGGGGKPPKGVEKLDPGMGAVKVTTSAGFRGPPDILLPLCVQFCP